MFPMEVSFPGLGINFSVNNVAFTIFGKDIYWYAIIIATGFLLAFLYAIFNAKRFGIDTDPMIDVVLVCVILGIIGARLYYVLFRLDVYKDNFWDVFKIWNGGLAIYGGVIAAFLGGWFMTKKRGVHTFAMFDMAAIGFLIGQGVGRWGNFINQEAFGTPTNLPWGMVSYNTGDVAVHPCFLYESLWCLAGVALLHFMSVKFYKFKGQLFFSYLAWYGLGRVWIEGLRTDSLWLIPNVIRVSQLVALLCVIVAGIFLYLGLTRKLKFDPAGAVAIEEEFAPEDIFEKEQPTSYEIISDNSAEDYEASPDNSSAGAEGFVTQEDDFDTNSNGGISFE